MFNIADQVDASWFPVIMQWHIPNDPCSGSKPWEEGIWRKLHKGCVSTWPRSSVTWWQTIQKPINATVRDKRPEGPCYLGVTLITQTEKRGRDGLDAPWPWLIYVLALKSSVYVWYITITLHFSLLFFCLLFQGPAGLKGGEGPQGPSGPVVSTWLPWLPKKRMCPQF